MAGKQVSISSDWSAASANRTPADDRTPTDDRTIEPLSRWSLILGIGSFVLLPVMGGVAAIIAGEKAKKAIMSSGGTRTGRRSAVVGEALGIVNVVVYPVVIVVVIVMMSAAASQHIKYTDLRTGNCYGNISGNLRSSVDKATCSNPHKTEVTGRFQAIDPGHFPGVAGLRTQAVPKCQALALGYLGNYSPNGLRIVWLAPDQALWDGGERTVVCGVQSSDGSERAGSVRG